MLSRDLFSGKSVSVEIDGRKRWGEYQLESGGKVVAVSSAYGCLSGEVRGRDPKEAAVDVLGRIIRTKG